MQQQSLGWVFLLFLVFGAGGCSTVSTFDRSQMTIEPDAYVAAFSFDTTALADWPFESAMVDLRNGPSIGMAGNESGFTMVMFEMSRSTLKLGELTLERKENEGTMVYVSTLVGPKVKLQKGSVTYIGSLVVDDVSLNKETGRPLAMRLRVTDDWESNELAWQSMFPVFEEHNPARRIAAGWGDSEEVELRPIQESSSWKLNRRQNPRGSPFVSTYNKRNRTTPGRSNPRPSKPPPPPKD